MTGTDLVVAMWIHRSSVEPSAQPMAASPMRRELRSASLPTRRIQCHPDSALDSVVRFAVLSLVQRTSTPGPQFDLSSATAAAFP